MINKVPQDVTLILNGRKCITENKDMGNRFRTYHTFLNPKIDSKSDECEKLWVDVQKSDTK